MPKEHIIRTRFSDILRTRLKNYIEDENKRGNALDESTVIRNALLDFLDKHEERPPLLRAPGQLNDRDKTLLRKLLAEPASSGKAAEHLDDREAAEIESRHPKKGSSK